MFKKISLFGAIFVAMSVFVTMSMYVENKGKIESVVASEAIPLPQSLTTNMWGIFDPETGVILTGNNFDTPHPIASITKLFTATAVLQSPQKNEEFKVISSDVNTEGRSGKLVEGMKTTPYELLFPLLLESSNDAAVAIERALDKTFIESTTDVIHSLLLAHTYIEEPTGLSSENVSTVADLSVFFSYLRKTYPHIVDITTLDTYIDSRTGYGNSNPLHSLPNFTGGKQGYTNEAKHTFVGTFMLPGSSKEIGIVLLQSNDLEGDSKAILGYSERLFHDSDILKL
ncbi:MAG: hypothetical protein WAW13_03020 [Minisyncoccia bacterium]